MKKLNPVVLLSLLLLVACAADIGGEEVGSNTASLMSLPGSNFEIDDDANLVVDGAGTDWASVTEARTTDLPTGTTDDSFGGGTKEDTVCPRLVTGSIPNNKSDLLSYGVWREPGSPGYLHLFWSRVQDPSGTTLIDFELNQSTTDCGNGVNMERTPGDVLIEYRLEQGGATATIKFREWDGTAWGPEVDLTAIGLATGTINTSPISAADSDGLGPMDPRTFGEATIDLDFLFDSTSCRSFGSAFVKSRSSDSFTSQLKDFIAPVPINLTNCGEVVIRKVTLPSGRTETFTFTHNLATDPATGSTSFGLSDGQSETFTNVLLGSGYMVTEGTSSDFALLSIDCSASTGVTPTVDLDSRGVSFDIDDTSDVVDCTFVNRLNRGSLVIQKWQYNEAAGGTLPHEGVQFEVTNGTETRTVSTDSTGRVCVSNLPFGDWTVTETVPDGYAALSSPQTVTVDTYNDCADAQVTTFYNQPLTNLVCTVDSQIPGGTLSRIDCTGGVSSALGDDVTVSLDDLLPGVYTCTVTVNP